MELNHIYIIGNSELNLNLQTHRISVLVGEIVEHGVPQGSDQGPLLFNVYVNDFPLQIHSFSEVILFADDTKYPCLSY